MKKYISNIILLLVLLLLTEKTQAQLFWNQACSFAGTSSSYVARGNSSSLNISGSFTIEAWINPVDVVTPAFQIILQKREVGNAVGYTLYLNGGKVTIRTNNNTRLVGKTVLSNNNWTHVAGTYNSTTGAFSVYVNGSLDTTVTIAGAAPVASTDSLFIGKGSNSPFAGQMDEVRIWNEQLSGTEINQQRRTSLGTSSGIYDGLVMSLTFQDKGSSVAPFSLTDWSGNNNNAFNKGVTAVDLNDRPYQTISVNECIELNGSNEYLAGTDNPAFSPSDELTLEAWIYPEVFDKSNVIIHKGSSDGTNIDYSFYLYEGKLNATINNSVIFTSDDLIPLNKWSHVAFTYDGPNGFYNFYLNGKLIESGVNFKGFITAGPDSVYIGGTPDLSDFHGFIDEVRIALAVKSVNEINEFLFKSIDESNDGSSTEAVYNFDGYAVSNVGSTNRLYFRNSANFSHSGAVNNQPLSPLNRADDMNFQEGFYLKTSDSRIPGTGTSGLMIDDTLNVFLSETITDVNVFVALNHTSEQNLSVSLVAPNGETVNMFNANSLVPNSDNLVTIFDDQSDSSIVNGRYVSLAPDIRPVNNLNAMFSGDNTSGKWRLVINDLTALDTGRLYGWGIQFNNRASKPSLLRARSLIQGFYNSSTNLMIRDTMGYYMRYTFAPFEEIDFGKAYLQTNGEGTVSFTNVTNGISYYLQLKHRNSIETWSAGGITFNALTSQAEYDFTTAGSQAYGDNMIQVDNAPAVKFAIFGGDVDQNGVVDGTDQALIDNDAFNFVTGYVAADITGDEIVDASDAAIADNNSANFVSAVVPVVLRPDANNKEIDKNAVKENELKKYSLKQNSPNPFNPQTIINYEIPVAGHVKVSVYDVSGRVISILVNEVKQAGKYEVVFNAGTTISSGTYFYKIESENFKDIKKMILVK